MSTTVTPFPELPTEKLEEIRTAIRKELLDELNIQYAKDLSKEVQRLGEEAKEAIQKEITKYQKTMTPPTDEEISKLVQQEYMEFTVKVRLPDKDGKVEMRDFVIQELPQVQERKFYKMIKKNIVPALKNFQSFEMQFTGGDVSEKVMAVLETIEPVFDVMTESMLIVLNPWEDNEHITAEFIQKNLSTNRMYSIMLAQIQANRVRDFLSRVSQSSWMTDAIR